MATSFNPFTGSFQSGDSHTGSNSGLAHPGSQPAAAASDSADYRHRNEGRWVGPSELVRGEGIERTVRSQTGSPVLNRDYKGTDLVTIPGGGQMTLDMAAQLGFATRNGSGGFLFSGHAGSDRAGQWQASSRRNPARHRRLRRIRQRPSAPVTAQRMP